MTVKASSTSSTTRALPYFDDPCALYQRLRHLGTAVLLDSGGGAVARGRFDIVAAQADTARSLYLTANTGNGELRRSLAQWQTLAEEQITATADSLGLPFYGGYVGHLSYELGRRLQKLPPAGDGTLPLAVAHYYPWAIVQDRLARRSWLVGETDTVKALRPRLETLLTAASLSAAPTFRLERPFAPCWSLSDYRQRFENVKTYIAAGDCYQINIGQAFTSHFNGDLFDAYATLRSIAKAPFSGFFPLSEEHALLCLSPERFLTVDQGAVEARPIKGTRPRHTDPARDQRAAEALLASDKERAENLMIVDLLRNDIGQFCEPGSVQAKELFSLESYSTVHHLVSVVTGQLSAKHSPLDLLLGCMPGGSITGAPKHRAMQIIDELEPAPRQAWCGGLFYLSRHGRLDSNIAIRTLFNEGQQLHCWAGGGLVYDSQLEAEYQEQTDKVGAFLNALEHMSKDLKFENP